MLTKARLETVPLGGDAYDSDDIRPTHIRCNNPLWDYGPEEVRFDITLNGQDYYGDFAFTFYEGIDLYRIAPMAGPQEGRTRVKLFGAGFNTANSKEDVFVKFGVVEAQKMQKEQVVDYIWASENEFVHNTMVPGSEVLSAYRKETYNVKKVDAEIHERDRLKSYIS